ncbi:MAG: hypothetical protein FWE60_01915 [Oscillospiraceae bacterium]|nr:hypothetical protein [Oscillospiraceae bacterium]
MLEPQSNKFVFISGQPNGNTMSLRSGVNAGANAGGDELSQKPVLRAGVRHPATIEEVFTEAFEEPDAADGVPDVPAVPEEPEEQHLSEQEQLILREEIIREYDALRQQYISEGEKARYDAKQWAQRLIETTENDIRKLYAKNEEDCAKMRKEADENGYKEGYDRGYALGDEKGYEEGYNKGLRKCKDTLKELISMLETIDNERDRFFKDHENQLFDAIFTIAGKITVDSLKQKEKAVITKMLREAAKGFRNSEFIKITLSKLDTEEMGTAGMDTLREIFRENQHVEFEIVKDAPSGTLIIDNGSEITDAGVATQLMMIEKLGKGKFREKAEDAPPVGGADTPL